MLVCQSGSTLCGPVNCNPSISSVHRISQARMLGWVAIFSSRGSSPPGDQVDSLLLNHLGSPRGRMVWLKILAEIRVWDGKYLGGYRDFVCACVTGPQRGDGPESWGTLPLLFSGPMGCSPELPMEPHRPWLHFYSCGTCGQLGPRGPRSHEYFPAWSTTAWAWCQEWAFLGSLWLVWGGSHRYRLCGRRPSRSITTLGDTSTWRWEWWNQAA